jgi:hypothetical protein
MRLNCLVFVYLLAVLRKPRKLEWVPQHGSVELDVTLPDGTAKTVKVSQLHATLLLHFQEKGI